MTNANGLASLEIGAGTPVTGTMEAIDWGSGPYYLKSEVDIDGGTSYSLSITSELLSVPYALYAETAGSSGASKIDDLSDGKTNEDGSSLFLGNLAGLDDDGGDNHNLGIGYGALALNTSARYNMAIGELTLVNNTTGEQNIAVGNGALLNNTEGSENIAIGNDALGSNLIGNGNVALGYRAGSNETGDNKLYIANSNTNTPLIYGEFDNKRLTLNGRTTVNSASSGYALGGIINTYIGDIAGVFGRNTVEDGLGYGVYGEGGKIGVRGIVTPTGTSTYYGVHGQVFGNLGTNIGVFGIATGDATNYGVYASGDLAYTGVLISASDQKLKTNINKLNNVMATIMSLQPRSYNFKESYQKSMLVSDNLQFGFMAQELQTVLPELVSENEHPGVKKEDEEISYLGINYIGLIPILAAGIQEQQEHIKILEDKIGLQKQTIERLKAEQQITTYRLNEIEALLKTSQQ
jgi:hypothetical protein